MTRLVLAHVGGAHEYGEDEVHEEVEGDEGDEEVVRLHRQLGLVQLHREEDGHDPHDLIIRGVIQCCHDFRFSDNRPIDTRPLQ